MFLREPSHLLLIILILILLFGAKRLPDSARALGRSLRIFKGELKDPNKNGDDPDQGNKKLDNPDKSE
ncbi:MAG: twin-arginine translocase TatA/TatE family subunit [Actinobacteria bacterium]|uniref:Sec-independent protein translocase protein TatA n=1 Tax=Candidatus Fonsibacter lacus TaxID=2576439 RepID=A0A965GBE0_9PROT|nr:twin-arginine translocase TatA/TatE family subunit [Candidatus Fonsibacter lacus]